MDNKTCIDIVVYKLCLLKGNVSSLINFVALPEDVNAAVFFFYGNILFIHYSSAKGTQYGKPIYIVFPSLEKYRKARGTLMIRGKFH